MRALDVCIFKLFLLTLLAASCEFHEFDIVPLDECSASCLKEMKPLFKSVWETEEKLKAFEVTIQEKVDAVQAHQRKSNDELLVAFNEVQCSNENKKSIDAMKTQLDANTDALKMLLNEIASLNSSIGAHKTNSDSQHKELAEDQAINCMPFQDSSNIHDIFVHGYGNASVLCDAQIAGSGWLVVQRRFDGQENFYRDWAQYKQGFGKLDAEFFLGLEVLHHLTKSLPTELYVKLVDFDNNVRHARYDNFLIGSEEEQYMLKSLGTYTGDAGDALSYNLHNSFTTYDRDNDGWPQGNCAAYYVSGGWFSLYANSNLNGEYYNKAVHSERSIWWYNWKGYHGLKAVQMMIRPKYTSL